MTSAPRFVPGAATGVLADPADRCLVVAGRELLVGADGALPRVAELPPETEWIPLGLLDGGRVWAAALPTPDAALGRWHGWPTVAAALGEPLAALAGRALQVVTWRHSHRYCGACRAELTDVPGEHARRCPACGLYVPMQLSPAVLVAIHRPGRAGGTDELLLVRHSYGPTELWALVAGFVEAGESLEEAVHREVAEEVSLRLAGVTYFGSQPWAMSGPGVVLAGFSAVCAEPDAEPVVDGAELTQARWFPLDALPAELPPAYSISRWLIDAAVATATAGNRAAVPAPAGGGVPGQRAPERPAG
ncbi:NAD(+) diphosphatase [Micromonospora sp. NPDC049559]|uniref:NAD(+) diphosphatase n=1 Tax=Micromonospora sp. NPDC049559 TaxID=3155923 RepID=UPI00342E8A7F